MLPVAEVVEVLSRHGWDGWLCWEYEKRWYESAAPLPELLGAGPDHLARLLNDSASAIRRERIGLRSSV
ncbi:hypothetical protein SGLAM104S_09369 [Streptomyces glaucescens]